MKQNHVPVEEGAHELVKLDCNNILRTTVFNLTKPEDK